MGNMVWYDTFIMAYSPCTETGMGPGQETGPVQQKTMDPSSPPSLRPM